MKNKISNFEINGDIWTLLPNHKNIEGTSLFNGRAIPSKTVLNLIGSEGVKKIDTIIKYLRESKVALFGKASQKSGFSEFQYFVQCNNIKEIKNLTLQELFTNYQFIICGCGFNNDFFNGKYNDLKKEKWESMGFNISAFRDYLIYTVEDTNEITRELKITTAIFEHEWEEIINGNRNTINEILGK
ncbi:MAG: hypothetical protein A2033_16080 [Bacteroidetes bacterium GWA2_31_9]|nr:MAG: hypothetical protein A2033_16080 [Bacteroidetes bacterium GWA2_31_9]